LGLIASNAFRAGDPSIGFYDRARLRVDSCGPLWQFKVMGSSSNDTDTGLAAKLGGLDHAHLQALADMAQGFAASLDIDETLRTAVVESMRYLDAEAGSIFTLDRAGDVAECRASAGPVSITGLRLRADQGIVGRAMREGVPQMIRDVSHDPAFNRSVDAGTGFKTRSILCAPLAVRGQTLGALELINKRGADGLFEESDRLFLVALASAAALAIHNARMAAQLVEQERVRKELEVAREIQRSLLPPDPPPDAPIHGLNIPARSVSGDLYLFFKVGRQHFFAVGDVAGKGVHAALFMAKVSSLLRAMAKLEHEPGRLLARVNDEIRETATRGMFVTLVAGLYDPVEDRVTFANAGHEPPLYRSRLGRFRRFPALAPPLGILSGLTFVEQELALDGGGFYVFTDGITEGRTDKTRRLTAEGFKARIECLAQRPSAERIKALVEPLVTVEGALHDDITLLLVERPG
jgi:sigma-B regulation protein RsbU (phosphoserine phosphatase)